MNKNIDLTEILKDCPKGFPLYSAVHGEVTFFGIDNESKKYPIVIIPTEGTLKEYFVPSGKLLDNNGGECILFPSKDQRDWSKFTAPWYKKDRFDPKTLKPFDKVLVKQCDIWHPDFYSCYIEDDDSHVCSGLKDYYFCIPYNDDTKHLAGTKDEAPEYYRYWED